MWFSADNLVLTAAQAACVALPAAGLPAWALRYRRRGWALIVPLSLIVVVAGIAVVPATADLLTWVALIGVPVGAALAFGWAMRGARPPLAVLAAALLAVAWAAPDQRSGELAALALIAASAVTTGRLLAGAAPLELLKAAVIAMAVADAALVFSNNLQGPNEVLVAAAPGGGLPQLQSASFGVAGMGYGDFFAAAVVGGILAAQRRPQLIFAALTLAISLAWDQLFLVYDTLPATVPPAIALIVAEIWARRRARRATAGSEAAPQPSMKRFSLPGMLSTSCPRRMPTRGPRITIPSMRPRSTSIQ
jgi:prepilin signal peptidase PulO-like enzyme (type II secretory pathway)